MTVIISGSDGFLGGKIIKQIIEKTELDILGLTIHPDLPAKMLERESIDKKDRIRFMTNDEFLSPKTHIDNIFGAVHLAFSRRTQPAKDIASSIVFSSRLFHRLAELEADRVINMSSQGVYGNTEEIRTEDTPPAPETHYTMAKYAAEILFSDILGNTPHHTSLRLDPVVQSQNVIKGLCKSAMEGKIKLKGGEQVFSFLDAEDAASAAASMLSAEGKWSEIYNVGWNRKRITLVELAKLTADAAEANHLQRPEIELEKTDISLWAGMDSSRFMEKTKWRPRIDLYKSIERYIADYRGEH